MFLNLCVIIRSSILSEGALCCVCVVNRELSVMFEVQDLPRVLVLRPDCSVLTPDAVAEICKLGPDCYRNWQEGAELIDRNFMMNEEFDEGKMRSMTDPFRRVKYKVEDKKKKKKKKDGVSVEEEDGDEDGNDGGGGGGWG